MLSTVWQNYWLYLALFSPLEARVPGLHVSYTYRGTNLKALLADPELWWADYVERRRIWPRKQPPWPSLSVGDQSTFKSCVKDTLTSVKLWWQFSTIWEGNRNHWVNIITRRFPKHSLSLCSVTHSNDGVRCNQLKKKASVNNTNLGSNLRAGGWGKPHVAPIRGTLSWALYLTRPLYPSPNMSLCSCHGVTDLTSSSPLQCNA